ncbi:MAG: TetR family transcriptional regulator [Acidimicrobiia bacterium]|nr:MAG: TetR family transcriptional regulator [Acidimicrobiia bacterium]
MTDLERRSSDAEHRRREILDAAATIFARKGYAATSIQDIAEAVEILKGSLYYYIDSKEDLLFEVIQEVHRDGLARLEAMRASQAPALERLAAFVRSHVEYNARNLTKISVFFHDFRSLSPERRQLIVEERDIYDHHLRGLIEQGQKEGTICPGTDPKMAAFAILGMMNWMYQWYRPDGDKSPEAIAEIFAEMAVRSVACPGRKHPGHAG